MESPTDTQPEVSFTYHLLIPIGESFHLLMQQTDADNNLWALPAFTPDETDFGLVDHINAHVWGTYNLFVSTLRCLHVLRTGNHVDRYYILDNYMSDWEPPEEMRWVEEPDLADMPLADDKQRSIIRDYFDWIHSDHSLRPGWMRPGWFLRVNHWMADLADRMSMWVQEPAVQRRTWSRSSIVDLHTKDGTLFLKAVPTFFAYEPVITRVLALRYPELLPDVRAVHVDNGWMLMREFEGVLLSTSKDFAAWKNAVHYYGEIQADLVTNTPSLIALGVPDRHLDYLASQIEGLVHSLPDSLTPSEKEDFTQLAPSLRNLCYKLLDYEVPLSLTHGDLWAGNIITKQDKMPLFFDWSDSAVAHPFFDIPYFLSDVDATTFEGIPDAHDQLRDAYLEVWTRYEPLEELRQAYAIAEVLGSLHQALIYHIHILPNLESNTRWEMSNMFPLLLRQVMTRAQAYSS